MGAAMNVWVFVGWLIVFTGNAGSAPVQDFRTLTPVQNLKSYALTICLARGFPDNKALTTETHAAARAYIDFGKFGIDAYNEAAALAHRFVAQHYESEHGEKLTVLKCLDLFHSKELATLAQKYHRLRESGKN